MLIWFKKGRKLVFCEHGDVQYGFHEGKYSAYCTLLEGDSVLLIGYGGKKAEEFLVNVRRYSL